MPTITVTNEELAILKHAVESYNDMNNDMMLDDVSVNLYPRGDEITTITANQAATLRNELYEAADRVANIRSLMAKVGSKVNSKGYSV